MKREARRGSLVAGWVLATVILGLGLIGHFSSLPIFDNVALSLPSVQSEWSLTAPAEVTAEGMTFFAAD